jgi:hypothetical protein
MFDEPQANQWRRPPPPTVVANPYPYMERQLQPYQEVPTCAVTIPIVRLFAEDNVELTEAESNAADAKVDSKHSTATTTSSTTTGSAGSGGASTAAVSALSKPVAYAQRLWLVIFSPKSSTLEIWSTPRGITGHWRRVRALCCQSVHTLMLDPNVKADTLFAVSFGHRRVAVHGKGKVELYAFEEPAPSGNVESQSSPQWGTTKEQEKEQEKSDRKDQKHTSADSTDGSARASGSGSGSGSGGAEAETQAAAKADAEADADADAKPDADADAAEADADAGADAGAEADADAEAEAEAEAAGEEANAADEKDGDGGEGEAQPAEAEAGEEADNAAPAQVPLREFYFPAPKMTVVCMQLVPAPAPHGLLLCVGFQTGEVLSAPPALSLCMM